MRYAIFSDIHGNWQAWNAILADMYECNVDVPVCLGDIVGYGPCPQRVLDGIREVTTNFVMGNHDAAATGVLDASIFNDQAREVIEWTRGQMTEDGLNFLREIPMVIEDGDIMFVHAEIEEPGRFLYIESEEEALDNFQYSEKRVTFVGHTHHPTIFAKNADGTVTRHEDTNCTLEGGCRYIINVGSVGEPRNPDDIRARYVIFDSDTNEVDFRRVDFDVEAYRADLDASDLEIKPYFLKVVDSYKEAVTLATQTQLMRDMETPVHAPVLLQKRSSQIMTMPEGGGLALRRATIELPPQPAVSTKKKANVSVLIYWIVLGVLALGGGAFWFINQKVGEDDRPERWTAKKHRTEADERRITAIEKAEADKQPKSVMKKKTIPDAKPTPISTLAYWHLDSAEDSLSDPPLVILTKGSTGPPLMKTLPATGYANVGSAKGAVWKEMEATGQFSLVADRSFTFECLFATTRPQNIQFLAGDRSSTLGDQSGWQVDVRGAFGGTLKFVYDPGVGNVISDDIREVEFFDGKPHHLAVVWNHLTTGIPNTGNVQIFVDGESYTKLRIPHSALTAEKKPFAIGGKASGVKGPPFAGYLDEVRLSAGVLPEDKFLIAATDGSFTLPSETAVELPEAMAASIPPASKTASKPEPKPDPVPEPIPTTAKPSGTLASFEDGLFFYAPFDEAAGERMLVDRSGSGRHMPRGGTVSGQKGKVGSAVHFLKKGVTSERPVFSETKNLTVAFWIRLDSEQVKEEMPAQIASIPNFFMVRYDDGQLQLDLAGRRRLTTINLEADGEWHHFILENDTEKTRVFVDGKKTDIEYEAKADERTSPPKALVALGVGDSRFHLDEVAMWRRILTDEEKQALFQIGSGGQPMMAPIEVVAHWTFDSPNGKIYTDRADQFSLGAVNLEEMRVKAPKIVPLTGRKNGGAAKVQTLLQPPGADSLAFALTASHGFTYEGWFLPTPNKPAFLGRTNAKGTGSGGWTFALAPIKNGERGAVMFRYEAGDKPKAVATDLNIYDGTPHHFAAVWEPHDNDNKVGEMMIYLDGQQVGAANLPHAIIAKRQSAPLQIGGKGNEFVIDELRFTKAVLPPGLFLNIGRKPITSN